MKTLVTGGTGFIGSRVVEILLREGHSVRLFSRRRQLPAGLSGKVELFQGDLSKAQEILPALRSVDVFYHIGEIKNTTRAASARNVQFVETVLENLGESTRLVFISSITVAGIPTECPAYEDSPQAVMLEDHYTEYKRKCEELIAHKAHNYAILRPAPVYGSGSKYLKSMISFIKKLRWIPFPSDGRNLAPLVHVKDLAEAIYLAGIKEDANRQIFNLTDGERHSWLDFFSAIAHGLGKDLRILPLPYLLLLPPAVFFDIASWPFGISLDLKHYIKYFSHDICFGNERATKLLSWQIEYSLNEGIKEMLENL